MSDTITPWWRLGSSRGPRGTAGWRVSLRTVLVLVAVCAVLIAAIAWLVHRLSPTRPAVLVGFWPDTDVPLPWSAADRDALLALGFAGPAANGPTLAGSSDALSEALDKVARTGANGRPVVLYLRAPIETDAGGMVHLNPTRTRRGGVRLQTVLERFRACGSKNKLLILDVVWADIHPDAVADPFPNMAVVLKDLDAVPDPDRTVLASCGPDQAAQSSAVLGRSVFGYYLDQGLRGAADGWNRDRSTDGRVSVRELYAYLQERLRAWSRVNRIPEEAQEPWLDGPAARTEGSDGDFTLLQVSTRPAPEAPAPRLDAFPEWLLAAWGRRDTWRNEGVDLSAPRLFHTLQSSIHAAEWEWRHGIADPEARLKTTTERLKPAYDRFQAATEVAPPGGMPILDPIPLADEKADAVVQKLLATPTAPPPPTTPSPAPPPVAPLPPGELTSRGVKVLLSRPDGPSPEQVRRLAGLIPDPLPSPLALFVRRLAADPNDPAAPRPVHQVRNMLRVVQEADADFGRRPAYPGLLGRADTAAQALHDAQTLFFARGYVAESDVDRAIEAAGNALSTLRAEMASLQAGEQSLNGAIAALGDTAGTARRSTAVADIWLRTMTEASRFAGLYLSIADRADRRPGPDEPGLPADFPRSFRALREDTRLLGEPFGPDAIKELVRRCDNSLDAPGELAEPVAVLASPRAAGSDRAKLWVALHALAGRLQKSTRPPGLSGPAIAAREPQSGRPSAGADPSPDRDRSRLQAARELRRRWVTPPQPDAHVGHAEIQRPMATDDPDTLPDGAERDFLGRVYPTPLPLDGNERVIDPARGWALRREAARCRWLADRFRYELQDSVTARKDDPAELAYGRWITALDAAAESAVKAAGERAVAWSPPGARPRLEFVTPPPVVAVGPPGEPPTVPVLEFRTVGAGADVRPALVFLDDRWFRVAEATGPGTIVPVGVAPIAGGRFRLALPFTMQPGGRPVPRGMLVRVTAGADGRSFHQRVTVALGTTPDFRFLVTPDPKSAGVPLDGFRVRPVSGQKFYLRLASLSGERRTVVVTLTGADRPPLRSKPIALTGSEPAAVEFPPALPTPAATGATPAPAAPPLAAPIALTVTDPDDASRELYREDFRPAVASPWEYIPDHAVSFDPAGPTGQPRVTFELRARRGLPAPVPVAELVFPADRNPFLVPTTAGTRAGLVPTDGSSLALFADGVLVGGPYPPAVATDVRIDGVDRAFRYRVSAARTGTVISGLPDLTPAVRVVVPSALRSGTVLPVRVEEDNVPAGARMELALLRPDGELLVPEAAETRASAREETVSLHEPPGPDGAFTLSATLRDWTIDFPTRMTVGRRVVRARLIDATGRELAVHEQSVLFDDRSPTDVRFVAAPPQAGQGTVIAVRATATAPLSGVREVRFAIGRPVNGKLPDAVPRIAGKPSATDPTMWEARVPVSPDLLGPVEVHAEFVSAVGVVGTGAAAVEVLAPAELARPKPTTIRGTVVEGEYFRAGLDVVLTDDRGAEKARAKTDEKGRFKFENLPAGKYAVASAKPDGTRKGSTPVEVKAGETAEVRVELYL